LLKVADEAKSKVTIYGQEKDSATSGLARMNMILHNNPEALIVQGNTITDPKFQNNNILKTFDFVVANPPFSDKRWSTGLDPINDPHERFTSFGIPPSKQGDYAYLLHIVRSLKSTGKGACILPHGVLFRGHSEADIRRNLIKKGYIKGIIGLPANLFYGTGIPACIVVIDKENAQSRKGIFMIDASKGFMKDGPKNRLRSQDIHKIVDIFNKQIEIPKFSAMISFKTIEDNEYNLNIPRYIDSTEPEDLQNIEGHLKGGIPKEDIDALEKYWDVCPNLRNILFKENRPGFLDLAVDKMEIKSTIINHPEFVMFTNKMKKLFNKWRKQKSTILKNLKIGDKPKEFVIKLSEDLLTNYNGKPLIDKYDIYQHLMDYWAVTMQDDCYIIVTTGWKAETYRIIENDKKGKEKDKGWTCDIIPKSLTVAKYFSEEQEAIYKLNAELDNAIAKKYELEEENRGEEEAFFEFFKINKSTVNARLKEIIDDIDLREEFDILSEWFEFNNKESELKKRIKEAEKVLDRMAHDKYPELTEEEVKEIVVNDKWFTELERRINGELDRINQTLTIRVMELAERYEIPLPQQSSRVDEHEKKVNEHLKRMGFNWM
jgi:type I restriction enzyme M protein